MSSSSKMYKGIQSPEVQVKYWPLCLSKPMKLFDFRNQQLCSMKRRFKSFCQVWLVLSNTSTVRFLTECKISTCTWSNAILCFIEMYRSNMERCVFKSQSYWLKSFEIRKLTIKFGVIHTPSPSVKCKGFTKDSNYNLTNPIIYCGIYRTLI